jgi:3-oxoacyl-[acyl-carrier protein] reductase
MHDIFDLSGEVALVTGASSGIGAHFASVLVDHGASVALVARRVEELDRLRETLMPKCYHNPGAAGVGVYPADVRDEVNINWVFDQIKQDLGPVSILINNAGIGHLDRALTIGGETWDRVLDVDLRSPLWYAQMAAPQMRERGKGSIINMGSVFGLHGSKGMIAYGVAKAGLIQLTKCLALELAEFGIRVNALTPGWCVTDMTRKYLESPRGATIVDDIPLKRFGQPDDLDGTLLLLASDAGRYITGTTITIDGGMSVWLRDGHKPEKTDETIRTRDALLA